MHKPSPAKASSATSLAIAEIRSNPLENGLYFALLDYLDSPEFKALSDKLGFKKPVHSSKARGKERDAFYIEFSVPDSFYPDQPYTRRAHLSIDKRYYEGEGGHVDPNRLKWHYAHYTEEYWDSAAKRWAHALHVYFNSLGQIVQIGVTDKRTTPVITTELEKEALGIIPNNITIAKMILGDLCDFRSQQAANALNKESSLAEKLIKATENAIVHSIKSEEAAELQELHSQHCQAKSIAHRYSDTLLHFADVDISEILRKAQQPPADKLQDLLVTPDLEEQTAPPKIAEDKSLVTIYLGLIDRLTVIMERAVAIKNDAEVYADPEEMEQLKSELIEILGTMQQLAKKSTGPGTKDAIVTGGVPIIQSVIRMVGYVATSKSPAYFLHPRTVTVRSLERNFAGLEPHIDESFIAHLLQLLRIGTAADKDRVLPILDFLGKKSREYIKMLSSMNKLTDDSLSSLALRLMTVLIDKDYEDAFKMFLEQGIDLSAAAFKNPSSRGTTSTLFTMLVDQLDRVNKDKPGDAATLSKSIRYLHILYDPRYKPDLSEDKKANHMQRWALEEILAQKRATARSETRTRPQAQRINVDELYMTPLEYALSRSTLPSELIEIIATNTQARELSFRATGLCYGSHALKCDPLMLLTIDTSDEKHIRFGINPRMFDTSPLVQTRIAQQLQRLLESKLTTSSKIMLEASSLIERTGYRLNNHAQYAGYTLGGILLLLQYNPTTTESAGHQHLLFKAFVQLAIETNNDKYLKYAYLMLQQQSSLSGLISPAWLKKVKTVGKSYTEGTKQAETEMAKPRPSMR